MRFLVWCIVFVFGVLVGYDFGAYIDGEFWGIVPDVMVEVHGLFFDLLIVGLVFLIFEKIQEERFQADKAKKLLKDLCLSPKQEDISKKCDAIKELNHLKQKTIHLMNVVLIDGDLKNVKIVKSELLSCNFNNADLWEAEMNGSFFTCCDFTETKFHEAKINDQAVFSGCVFGETRFFRTELKRAKFRGENLFKTYFHKAILTDADFSEANLMHTDFRAADITRAIFDGAFVPEDWFNRLDVWQSTGREQIIRKYDIVEFRPHEYRLKLKD
jgi:hypothetical protein